MTGKTLNQRFGKKQRGPDLVNAEIALKRAAGKAREIARKEGTSVVIFRDGEIREEQGNDHAQPG